MFNMALIARFHPESVFFVTSNWMGATEIDSFSFFHLMDWSTFGNRSILLILFSLIAITIGILGMLIMPCGEDLKNIYLICVGIMMAMEFLCLMYFMTRWSRTIFKYQLTNGMSKSYRKYLGSHESENEIGLIVPKFNDDMMNITLAWFKYQSLTQCCGVKGNFKEFELESKMIPPSCCKLKNQNRLPKDVDEYVNFSQCQTNRTVYAIKRGCVDPVFAALLLNSQMEELALLFSLAILTCSLGITFFLDN